MIKNVEIEWDKEPKDEKRLRQNGDIRIEREVQSKNKKKYDAVVKIEYFDYINVDIPFTERSSDRRNIYTKTISGELNKVFSSSLKIIEDEERKYFLELWSKKMASHYDQSLQELVTTGRDLRVGKEINREENYGLFTTVLPSQILATKIKESGLTNRQIANDAGIDEATLYRHTTNTSPISRKDAIQYGKIFGCDPASILFNDLYVPVWGSVNFEEMKSHNKKSVYAGEIIKNEDPLQTEDIKELVICPRQTYRPDVHAVKLVGGAYDGNFAFYYHSKSGVTVNNGTLVVAGVKIKDFGTATIRLRYFVGMVEKNYNTINLVNPDSSGLDLKDLTPDEDFNSFDDIVGYVKDNRLVIEDVKPEFIAPIVSIVNPTLVEDNETKQKILKNYNEQFVKARNAEALKEINSKTAADEVYEFKKSANGKLIIGRVGNIKRFFRQNGAKEIDKVFAKGTNNVTLFEVDKLIKKYSIYHPVLKKYLNEMGIFSATEEMKQDVRDYTDEYKDVEDQIA